MTKTRKTIFIIFSIFTATSPLFIAEASPKKGPNVTALINTVIENSKQIYEGQLLTTTWGETETKTEDVKIYFLPPNKYRFEFLRPNGDIDRTVISDGTNEEFQLKSDKKTSNKVCTRNPVSLIKQENEKALLLSNYTATLKGEEKILNRMAWVVELTPNIPGKPIQQMKIDQKTNVILEIKRFFKDGKTGSLMRFTQFDPKNDIDRNLFVTETLLIKTSANKEEVEYRTTDLSKIGNTKNIFILPTTLHGGFSLERGDQFEVQGKFIKHMRYTDGLLPVSIFQSPLPVKAMGKKEKTIHWSQPLQLGSADVGNVYQWKKNNEYFTLIGDVNKELLQEIAGALK